MHFIEGRRVKNLVAEWELSRQYLVANVTISHERTPRPECMDHEWRIADVPDGGGRRTKGCGGTETVSKPILFRAVEFCLSEKQAPPVIGCSKSRQKKESVWNGFYARSHLRALLPIRQAVVRFGRPRAPRERSAQSSERVWQVL